MDKYLKMLCVFFVVVGFVLFWLVFFLYGIKLIELVLLFIVNGILIECLIDDLFKNMLFLLVYEVLYILVFLVGVFFFVILYIFIGRCVWFFVYWYEVWRVSFFNGLDVMD